MKKESSSLYWLLAMTLLGAGVRILFLLFPHMDSDQAINGLMARHVLQGEFPFFFYGQDYCGSIEAYLISSVFFLFGVSRYTLDGAIGLLSLSLIPFVFYLTRRLSDRQTALWAALLAALPSYYLVFHSVLPRSAYIEIPLIGVLLFIVSHKILSRAPTPKGHHFLLGLFLGLGIWTHFLLVYYLPPIFFLLLSKDRRFSVKPAGFPLFLGLMLGGLPLWTHNILHPLATWHYLLETSGGGEAVGNSLRAFFQWRLPEILGLRNNEREAFIIPYVSFFLYLVYLACFLYWLFTEGQRFWSAGKGRTDPGWGGLLLPLYVLMFPFIFAFSGFAAAHTSRYLMPLFSALPVAFALVVRQLRSLSRLWAWLFLALHLMSNLWGTLERSPLFFPDLKARYLQTRANDEGLLKTLQQHHIRRLYCPDYWTSVRLTFDAREEVLVAAPFGDRYPTYTRLIDQSPRAAFLFPGDNGDFEATLKAIGGSYRKSQWFGYSVYHDFSPPPYDFVEVVPAFPGAGRESEVGIQKEVFDRDLNTRWSTGVPQKPGMSLLVDLGRSVPDLGRVTLFSGAVEDLPRGIRLEISTDGRRWKKVVEVPSLFGSLFWSGPHPFHRPEDKVDLIFAPQAGRFLRLTQLGEDPVYHWSIAECFIYQTIPRTSPPDSGVQVVLSYFLKAPPSRLYADPWLNAHREGSQSVSRRDIEKRPEEGVWLRATDPVTLAVEKAYSSSLTRFFSDPHASDTRSMDVAGYRIVTWSPPSSGGRTISRKAWKASANVHPEETRMALDGKIATRWTTGRPQRPGDFIQIDLGKVERVSGLRCLVGDSRHDFPRLVEVLYSEDGNRWASLDSKMRPVNLRWTGETLVRGGPDLEVAFPPVFLRFLRLVQKGEDPVYYWSVHELELLP